MLGSIIFTDVNVVGSLDKNIRVSWTDINKTNLKLIMVKYQPILDLSKGCTWMSVLMPNIGTST